MAQLNSCLSHRDAFEVQLAIVVVSAALAFSFSAPGISQDGLSREIIETTGLLAMLARPGIADELDLTDEQIRGLEKTRQGRSAAIKKLFLELESLPPDARKTRSEDMLNLYREYEDKGMALLQPFQAKRAKQLSIQSRLRDSSNSAGLLSSYFAGLLEISEAQTKEINKISSNFEIDVRKRHSEFQAEMRKLRAETQRKMEAVLTPKQLEKYQEIYGKAIELESPTRARPTERRPDTKKAP